MIHYYINPKTQELIAFDDETREVALMEPVGGIIQTERTPAKPVSSPSKPAYVPNQTKQRLCSVCQKPGHTATTCLKNRPSNFGDSESSDSDDEVETDSKLRRAPAKQGRPGIDEATIKLIRELHDAGKTIGEIKEATGCSYATIYRYRKFTPEPYEPEDELDDKTADEPVTFGESSRGDGEDEDSYRPLHAKRKFLRIARLEQHRRSARAACAAGA
jgi:hypothetical protein